MVKPRKAGGIGAEKLARLIMRARVTGRTEQQIDDEIAWLEWKSGFTRMWRYIALQMGASR
jgi:hypothetical protein